VPGLRGNVGVRTLTRGPSRCGETARVNHLRRGLGPAAEIDLLIDLTTEPIQGVLRHPHGADKPFAGWVALIRVVELALEAERLHHEPPRSG
jgi:hypothetical protein